MIIQAKFRCGKVTRISASEEIELDAVYDDGSEDNKSWSEATPAGSLTMTISNRNAWGAFEPGKFYSLVISPYES